ncbi:MAG: PilZ domain-containing protein [Candidatus Omnitrophota bacterium]
MMWEGINRRQFPRANYPCKVIVLGSSAKEVISTHTENIGKGGICVILSKELPKFFPVEIILYLKDGEGPLECNARIVWCVKTEIDFDTGIEFLDIDDNSRTRIGRIVQQCLDKKI